MSFDTFLVILDFFASFFAVHPFAFCLRWEREGKDAIKFWIKLDILFYGLSYIMPVFRLLQRALCFFLSPAALKRQSEKLIVEQFMTSSSLKLDDVEKFILAFETPALDFSYFVILSAWLTSSWRLKDCKFCFKLKSVNRKYWKSYRQFGKVCLFIF